LQEALARRIGVVRHTLYGGMWATSAEGGEQAHNDTAYTNHALNLHTDCTYMVDPPGLQVLLQL
jgi:trimethyllysine dioxygenase